MTLIVDASVAAKWFVEEEGSSIARALRGTEPLMAPDFLLLEAFHIFWKRAQRGLDDAKAANDVLAALTASFDALVPSNKLIADAARCAVALAHPVHDCLYIALAEREAAVLVTADLKQVAAARKARVKVRLL